MPAYRLVEHAALTAYVHRAGRVVPLGIAIQTVENVAPPANIAHLGMSAFWSMEFKSAAQTSTAQRMSLAL